MQKRKTLLLGSLTLLALMFVLGSSIPVESRAGDTSRHLATLPSELPVDTKSLEIDKAVTDSLSPDKPGQFYKFEAKADQLIRLSIEPKSRDLYAMLTILDTDLQTVYGGTEGEAVIGGSIIVRIPTDGTYIVSVDYSYMMIGNPTAGSYDLLLSEFTPK
jgi:hypothetical protein